MLQAVFCDLVLTHKFSANAYVILLTKMEYFFSLFFLIFMELLSMPVSNSIFNNRIFSDEVYWYTYRIFFLVFCAQAFERCAEVAKASGLVQDLCTSICTTISEVVTVPNGDQHKIPSRPPNYRGHPETRACPATGLHSVWAVLYFFMEC